jgi:hypothetical protein
MKSDLILIIVVCSFVGTVVIYSCFSRYRTDIRKEQDKNRISSVHKKLKRKNTVTPITHDEEIKDEQYNDITTVEIRTAEHFV